MPKTRCNTRSDSHNSDSATCDPTTASTYALSSRSQLQSLTVAALQQELKASNLCFMRNKAVLSQCLHDTLQLPADTTTQLTIGNSQSATGQASMTPTQHSNLTTSQNDAPINETLCLLLLQLQQLPPQQLSTLLLQVNSGDIQTPITEAAITNPTPPTSQNHLVIPTSGATVTSSSQLTASLDLLPQLTANSQKHPPPRTCYFKQSPIISVTDHSHLPHTKTIDCSVTAHNLHFQSVTCFNSQPQSTVSINKN